MPDMDGIETFEKVKNVDRKIPVIMMTAYSSLAFAVSFMKAEGADFIHKPVDPDILEVKLRQAISNSRLRHQMVKLENEKSSLKAVIEAAGDLAHEINNPLNSIFTSICLMEECFEGEGIGVIIERMKDSMQRIHQVVIDLERTVEARIEKMDSLS